MDVTNRFKELGAEVVMSTPAEFTSLIRSTHEKMGDLINKKNIQLN
jgi:hypothetical protein